MTKIVTTPNAAASQTEHPWRATLRTFVQALIPSLAGFVLVVPAIVSVVVDEFARAEVVLPGWAYTGLVGLSVACALVAAIVARIMAIPGVEASLRTVGLGAAPDERYLSTAEVYPVLDPGVSYPVEPDPEPDHSGELPYDPEENFGVAPQVVDGPARH